MTPSLLKRFDAHFYQDTDQNDRVTGWLGRIHSDNTRSIAGPEDVKDFLRAALLEIKDGMAGEKWTDPALKQNDDYKEGFNAAIDDCLAILTRALEE